MEIKIFGSGCSRCTEAEKLIKEVVAARGITVDIQKISDLKEIMMAGVLSTPAVAVNGVVKCVGRVPTKEDILSWL